MRILLQFPDQLGLKNGQVSGNCAMQRRGNAMRILLQFPDQLELWFKSLETAFGENEVYA